MGFARRRTEDARFIQGKGNYVDDLKLPGMLHGDFVRSPYGHARIKKIDVSRAAGIARRGGGADRRGAEAGQAGPGRRPSPATCKWCWPTARCCSQNQEVAFVIAQDRYIAADAVELVEMEYEPLPPLVDPFKAMAPDAPILREDIKDKLIDQLDERKHPNHIFELGGGRQGKRPTGCSPALR